jgi:acetyl esterase/lipase
MTHTGLLVLAIGLANPAGCAAAEKVDTHPDLVYAEVDGQKLQLDLFMPADVKKPPLIVYIHGGSWMRSSPRSSG